MADHSRAAPLEAGEKRLFENQSTAWPLLAASKRDDPDEVPPPNGDTKEFPLILRTMWLVRNGERIRAAVIRGDVKVQLEGTNTYPEANQSIILSRLGGPKEQYLPEEYSQLWRHFAPVAPGRNRHKLPRFMAQEDWEGNQPFPWFRVRFLKRLGSGGFAHASLWEIEWEQADPHTYFQVVFKSPRNRFDASEYYAQINNVWKELDYILAYAGAEHIVSVIQLGLPPNRMKRYIDASRKELETGVWPDDELDRDFVYPEKLGVLPLEYAEYGTLWSFLSNAFRKAQLQPGNPYPFSQTMLWQMWTCLVMGVASIAYQPGDLDQRDPDGDLDQLPVEELLRCKEGRDILRRRPQSHHVHFDMEEQNILMGREHKDYHRAILKFHDFGPPFSNDMRKIWESKTPEHWFWNMRGSPKRNRTAPEQFHQDWERIKYREGAVNLHRTPRRIFQSREDQAREDKKRAEEPNVYKFYSDDLEDPRLHPIAGRYGTWTNLFLAAQIMEGIVLGAQFLHPQVAKSAIAPHDDTNIVIKDTYGWRINEPEALRRADWKMRAQIMKCMSAKPADRPHILDLVGALDEMGLLANYADEDEINDQWAASFEPCPQSGGDSEEHGQESTSSEDSEMVDAEAGQTGVQQREGQQKEPQGELQEEHQGELREEEGPSGEESYDAETSSYSGSRTPSPLNSADLPGAQNAPEVAQNSGPGRDLVRYPDLSFLGVRTQPRSTNFRPARSGDFSPPFENDSSSGPPRRAQPSYRPINAGMQGSSAENRGGHRGSTLTSSNPQDWAEQAAQRVSAQLAQSLDQPWRTREEQDGRGPAPQTGPSNPASRGAGASGNKPQDHPSSNAPSSGSPKRKHLHPPEFDQPDEPSDEEGSQHKRPRTSQDVLSSSSGGHNSGHPGTSAPQRTPDRHSSIPRATPSSVTQGEALHSQGLSPGGSGADDGERAPAPGGRQDPQASPHEPQADPESLQTQGPQAQPEERRGPLTRQQARLLREEEERRRARAENPDPEPEPEPEPDPPRKQQAGKRRKPPTKKPKKQPAPPKKQGRPPKKRAAQAPKKAAGKASTKAVPKAPKKAAEKAARKHAAPATKKVTTQTQNPHQTRAVTRAQTRALAQAQAEAEAHEQEPETEGEQEPEPEQEENERDEVGSEDSGSTPKRKRKRTKGQSQPRKKTKTGALDQAEVPGQTQPGAAAAPVRRGRRITPDENFDELYDVSDYEDPSP